ncbi:FtsQ-type POTRA domain-containing protein [Nocardioides sp. KIGAM211]|uniref:Cell division protein FtsQ n=1 Tax=Nocardioides luti TaxID=2761101 RepID=A0A7X0V962_9ACTN|nr:FtsQ-type POTRA domain-containing protein [Nocardioides luti]MBB6626339.1 FtsQ-type POTRA domain-containing protein [Nocardioides luti]
MRRTATAEPAGSATTVRSRRRFARRQWARRWLAWKYVVALLVLVGLVAGAIWAVYFSSFLAVQGVRVEGVSTISAREIRDAAAVPSGEPLARVDLDRIRSRVESLAEVRSADVTRQWPDQVLVTVTERVAVAVVDMGGRIRGLDDQGVLFRDYARAPAGLPRVQTQGDTRSDALREAARVVGALPRALAGTVDHVEVATVDQITLVLEDGRTVEWGSADESAQKAEVIAALLKRPAQTYDVSVPGQPTTSGTR